MKLSALAFISILLISTTLGWAAEVTLTGSQIQDAMLVQESSNDNFGGRADFEVGVVGNGQVRTSVMRFDVTDPALGLFNGNTPLFTNINSITLTLTALSNISGNNMDIRVAANQNAQGNWIEGTGTTAASGGDAGNVTYSERQEGVAATAWSPDTNYTRGIGDGVLGTATTYPGDGVAFSIALNALPGETLDDLVLRWATGANEGVLINDFNRTGFARWVIHSSEATNANFQPRLTINFDPVPEPTSIALWTFVGILGATACFAVGRRKTR